MDDNRDGFTKSFVDLVPDSWFKIKDQSSVWISGFKSYRIPEENFEGKMKLIDLNQVRIIALWGNVNYLDTSKAKMEMVNETYWKMDVSKVQEYKTPEGAYLLLITPFNTDGKEGNEVETKQKISDTVGLLAAFNGRNMVYEHLFNNVVRLSDKKITVTAFNVEVPAWFAEPDISDSKLKIIEQTNKRIDLLEDQVRNRIRLSLRWFESAIYDKGIDSLLKYWISIETLAMPDTTNIKVINEILSSAYKRTLDEVRDLFEVGRLFGLRSSIVHEGFNVPIGGLLLKYLEALYVDILFGILGLPCESRAEEIIKNPEFSLKY